MVEYSAVNREVGGSTPLLPAISTSVDILSVQFVKREE
jgi:hypothetical protein